jgi:5-methyltetrahydrofolate corrinoid/iron sulfur protein methyltransferase
MMIIGERINATRKAIKEALGRRDGVLIRGEARSQVEAGAEYLDVNGGTTPTEELANLEWLCDEVQAEVEVPLAIDSASPAVIAAGLARARHGRALVNSISMESGKHEAVLPLVAEHRARVVALAMDDGGIPRTAADRLRVVERIVAAAQKSGLALADVYVDPLVMALSSSGDAGRMVLDVLDGIRRNWPELRSTCGLSNISFGLPQRGLLNRSFLLMAMAAGLSAAILDPLDAKLMTAVRAGRSLLGQDEYCMDFISAHRAGKLVG